MIVERSRGHFDYEGCIATMLWESALRHVEAQYPETNFMRPATDSERNFMEEEADSLFVSYSRSFCEWLVGTFIEDEWGRG